MKNSWLGQNLHLTNKQIHPKPTTHPSNQSTSHTTTVLLWFLICAVCSKCHFISGIYVSFLVSLSLTWLWRLVLSYLQISNLHQFYCWIFSTIHSDNYTVTPWFITIICSVKSWHYMFGFILFVHYMKIVSIQKNCWKLFNTKGE